MQLFYVPEASISQQLLLSPEESRHCVKVLRKQAGDIIQLTDGQGSLHEAKIVEAHAKKCAIEVVRSFDDGQSRNYQLTIAIAPTKNIDRFEWFIEKAVEIGIDRIIPIVTHHSERRRVNLERLERIVISAMKQSAKATKPLIADLTKYKDFLKESISGQQMIATCDGDDRTLLKATYKPGTDITILVGPEGDFSEEEVMMAKKAGYQPISLGNARLRTETAGVVICQSLYFMNQE